MFECLNNIKALELETEKGILQGHARRWMAHALRSPKLLKAFIKALLKKLMRREVASCCELFGVKSFVLEVRSWSDNNVPVSPYQVNFYSLSWQEKQGPKAQLSPPKVPILAKRRQVSVGSSFSARPPHPAQLSSLKEPGAQLNWPSGSSGRSNHGSYVLQTCDPGRLTLLLVRRGRDEGGSLMPQGLGPASGQPWPGLWSLAKHSPQIVRWGPQLTCWPKAGWAGGPRGEAQDSPLASLCLTTTTLPAGWVAHQQLLAWRRDPPWCWPMAERLLMVSR